MYFVNIKEDIKIIIKEKEKMKFIHTADLHLGYKFSSEYSSDTSTLLSDNQKKVLTNIINLGNENKIDAIA